MVKVIFSGLLEKLIYDRVGHKNDLNQEKMIKYINQKEFWSDGEVANTAVCKTAIRGCKSRSDLKKYLKSQNSNLKSE